jgi:hypothetical protein
MSIFDLKTDVNQLSSSNEGTSNMSYHQHPPSRDVTGPSFANGAQHFRFQCSGSKWWVPARSYLRMRAKITNGAGDAIDLENDVAPNMGLMANLFQSMEMRINDKVVSRVSDFVPQIDALETRLTKSKSWLDSIGKSTNFWDSSYLGRQNDISNDGTRYSNDTNLTDRTSVELGYTAPNTMTVSFANENNRIEIQKNAGVNLPTGVWQSGDIVEITTGTLSSSKYEVTNVVTDTVDTTRLTVAILGMPTVANEVFTNFRQLRGNRENLARRANEFEMTWCPSVLSLFKVGHAMPTGKYELVLNPQTSTVYQQRAIQSLVGNRISGTDFKFQVVDFYLYTSELDGPRVSDLTYLLDLSQTRCQAEKIDNINFGQKNMDVSPSTVALTIAYQDVRVGEDTRLSSSIFKSYPAVIDATLSTPSSELALNRLFINYGGVNRPAPDASPEFKTGTDNTVQRYVDSQIYSGAMYDTGGAETIQEFHKRGSYYYFSWPKSGDDRSTRVNVHQGFNIGTDVTNLRLLLFDHSKQVARIKIQDSQITSVELEDM